MLRLLTTALVLGCLVVGCSSPASPTSSADTGARSRAPTTPKRLTAAIQSDPATLIMRINPTAGGLPGVSELGTLIGSGLSTRDADGAPLPLLAESVPTLENGLWQLLPDGRMETTWRLRGDAVWHDDAPFNAADVAFTTQVEQDKEIDIIANPAYQSVESIEVIDPRTVLVRWKRPFIDADKLFELPLFPKHLLESTYATAKPGLVELPYWSREYVGTGPYKLKEFAGGSHVLLEANARYVLGRPKIDEIEVKFILDPNTLSANVLAGTVELTLGRSLSYEEAAQTLSRWNAGWMDAPVSGWVLIWSQLINPNPPVIGDVRFRRALLEAIDRQQVVQSFVGGQIPVPHAMLSPDDPLYPAIESHIVRYTYDPNRAAQAIQELGYRKGPDGLFDDAAGQPLRVELRATGGRAINEQANLVIADYWRSVGVATDPVIVPLQRQRDREYVQTFPSFWSANQPNDFASLYRYVSSQIPLAENNYVGNNNSRYASPEYDALVNGFFSTIPLRERTAILGDIVHHMSDQLPVMPVFFNSSPALFTNRLQGVNALHGQGGNRQWNVQEWDVRS